jgi:caffeoyl-CoA O-methyltransferase
MIVSKEIQEYCETHSTRLPALADAVLQATSDHPRASMTIGRLVGGLLRLLIVSNRYERILEIGSFAGFSAILMALSMPDGGHLWTLEENLSHYQLLRENIRKCGLSSRITAINAEGFTWLKESGISFQMILLDARKELYAENYTLLTDHLDPRGLLIVDNTLCRGKVLSPETAWETGTAKFNQMLAHDGRFHVSLVPVRDGLTLAYRISADAAR